MIKMKQEEIKKIINQIEDRLVLHEAIKEPISKDLDKAIKLSVAYEELLKEKQELIEYLKERIRKCNEDKEFWLRRNELESHDIREAERGTYEEILNKIEKRWK